MNTKSSRNQVKLSFGLRNNELVHISEVPSGLACECYCAACQAQLIAKKGPDKAHHFAHYQAEECEHAVETALHLAAKKVLEQAGYITLPELLIHEQVWGEICGQIVTKSGTAKVCEFHNAAIDYVRLEDRSLTKIIPDVIAYINGNPLIIEVGVTHFVDDKKEKKIHTLNIPTLEIDLSDVERNADLELIRSIVIDSIDKKTWLFHSATEKFRLELKTTLEAELQTELNKIYEKEQERKRKGEEVFACDRRAWQAWLFSFFIYKKFEKYEEVYAISINQMINWCKNSVPLNWFVFSLWSKREFLDRAMLNVLQDFDLYGAIREFARHLEREGFIRHLYKDKYKILKDRFVIHNSNERHDLPNLIDGKNIAIYEFSEDDQERFHERAGIIEFCGGFRRSEAERLTYEALSN